MKLNKSPGNDGLTSELYKLFSKDLSRFLHKVYIESIANEKLPPSLNQGLITLIPKPQKDSLLLDNWRPISLLNNDYKIIATLDDIIDETQSGFMTGRHITNNIRLVIDILDHSELITDNSFILFLDFYKAFDSIEHKFMFKALDIFGFGNMFKRSVKTLYAGANSSIKLPFGTTKRFNINRGIRQGCPISAYLFLLPMQLLSIHFKNSDVLGLSIVGRTLSITQLADDTTLFLKDKSQVGKAIKVINTFSMASGLKLNISKCELLPIKSCTDTIISGIPVKHKVKYLGIIIEKDQSSRLSGNFDPLIASVQQRFNLWLQRDLSITGRSLVAKVEGLSRLIYAAMALDVSKDICTKIDRILFEFIWKKRIHYIKKNVMINKLCSGGLNSLDFTSLNSSFKVKWIKLFLKNPNSIWNFITAHIFNSLGGLHFLLRCNYNILKLPIKLSNFHRQLLLSWSMMYSHNFSPHKYFIWNNQDIRFKNKSLYIKRWVDNKILLVSQLMNDNGQLFTYEEFLSVYGFPVTPREYSIVFDAIPEGVRRLLLSAPKGKSCIIPGLTPDDIYIGNLCPLLSDKATNQCIRNIIQRDIVSKPAAVFYWNNIYNDIDWKNTWILSRKFLITNKVREVTFKLLHRCYPVKTRLVKYKINIDTLCSFCGNMDETICHLFWDCTYSHVFWIDLNNFINNNIDPSCKLNIQHVLFGLSQNEERNPEKMYIINLLLIFAKFHIHCTKFAHQRPNIIVFKALFSSYLRSLKNCMNSKASKTRRLCEEYNLT